MGNVANEVRTGKEGEASFDRVQKWWPSERRRRRWRKRRLP